VSLFGKGRSAMNRPFRHSLIAGFALLGIGLSAVQVAAQEEEAVDQGEAIAEGHAETMHFPLKKPPLLDWSFAGVFGNYDPAQLQRGFQVYREVCAFCHGLKYVAFRNLGEPGGPGFSAAEVAALAAEYEIADGPNEEGEMFTRPGRPSDRFPSPFPNDQAAAAANGGALPPDLSLMAKARGATRGPVWTVLDFFTQYQEAGPNYIHALLTGYGQEPPHGLTIPDGVHFNPYFLSGPAIAMPEPLSDGVVKYSDGSPRTVDQYSTDVAAFLMWTAEPHLVARKHLGFQVMIFLIVFASLMYLTKRRVWASVAH
jgi:ubiquinol-cytochrome c reductase cytochrome c1 subunit